MKETARQMPLGQATTWTTCGWLYEGGIRRGQCVGATDKYASDVAERPISPNDLLATMYHLLGIEPDARIPHQTGRPVPLLPEGSSVVPEMLA